MLPSNREPKARYPKLRLHRITLGWSIPELLRRTEQPPSEKSVRRLEKGEAVMLRTVNRLYATIEKHWDGKEPGLDRRTDIIEQ